MNTDTGTEVKFHPPPKSTLPDPKDSTRVSREDFEASQVLVQVGDQDRQTGPPQEVPNAKFEVPQGMNYGLYEELWGYGEILPENNELSILLGKIGQKLGLPADFMIIGLDSDMENAFFMQKEKTLVFSRGLAKLFLQNGGLDLKEDHIAAILCHELEHKHTEDRVEKRKGIWFTDVKSDYQMQSEEMRADADGMARLAKAGYNPRAMIEAYQAIGLTQGRDDRNHPEIIDRIRHLEGKLYDDINPIPNSGKKMKDMQPGLVDYLKADSLVYQETERLLSLSADELRKMALASETLEDYWKYYDLERHARRVEYARAFCQKEPVARFVRKAILLQTIYGDNRHVSNYIIDGHLEPGLGEEAEKDLAESSGWASKASNDSYLFQTFTVESGGDFLEALPYRMGLNPGQVSAETMAQFEARLQSANQAIDVVAAKQVEYIGKNLHLYPESFQKHFAKVKQLLADENQPLDADVLSTAFIYLDKRFQDENFQAGNRWRSQKGLRLREQTYGLTVDFSDPLAKQKALEGISLSTTMHLLDTVGDDLQMQKHLGTLLEKLHGFTPQEADLFSDYYFQRNENQWFAHLDSVPRTYLPDLHKKLVDFKVHSGHMRHSPREKGWAFDVSLGNFDYRSGLNKGYLEGRYPFVFRVHPFFARADSARKSYMDAAGAHCLWALYKRGLPTDYNYDPNHNFHGYYEKDPQRNWRPFDKTYNGKGMDLTSAEWSFILSSYDLEDTAAVSNQRRAIAFNNFFEYAQTNRPVPDDVLEAVRNINYIYYSRYAGDGGIPVEFTLEKILILHDHAVWPAKAAAVHLANLVDSRGLASDQIQPEQRDKLINMLQEIYHNYPDSEQESEGAFGFKNNQKNRISGMLLDLYTDNVPKNLGWNEHYSPEQEEKIIGAFRRLHEGGLQVSTGSLYSFDKFQENVSDEALVAIADIYADQPRAPDDSLSFCEFLKLWSITPDSVTGDPHMGPGYVHPEAVQHLFSSRGYADSLKWILDNFQVGSKRDELLTGWAEQMEWREGDSAQKILKNILLESYSGEHVVGPGRKDNRFSFKNYPLVRAQVEKGKLPINTLELYKSSGRRRSRFPDILKRRHSFATLARPLDYRKLPENGKPSGMIPFMVGEGTTTQRLIDLELIELEEVLLSREKPLEARLNTLTAVTPIASPVRDTYVEFILEDELSAAPGPKERLDASAKVLPLFSEKCDFKKPFVLQMLRDEIAITPQFYQDGTRAVDRILTYLPRASLDRNFFLDQVEQKCSLSPAQIIQMNSLRVTDEGQRQRSATTTFTQGVNEDIEAAPEVYVLNRLSEQNRPEKCKTVLWVLGVSAEKPLAVAKIEKEEDGSLDSFKAGFARLTPPERDVLLKRMFLGAEGILDLEAVTAEKQAEAQAQRDKFLTDLAKSFIPSGSPESALFQDLFVTIYQNAPAARASQMLSKLINSSVEQALEGKKLSQEQLVAQTLNQVGVVGKKVAQSLAEMDWIPSSYRTELSKSQEGAEMLPKRSLLVFAQAAELVSGDAGLRIISLDKLLGAASNKQACMMTVEVRSQELASKMGVKVGETAQVVGKFKRPSAQKEENIDDDLKLMQKVVEVIRKKGTDVSLPPGFTDQIGMAVRQELDFEKDKVFAEKLGPDIEKRAMYKGWQVGLPTILYCDKDVIIETPATGETMRSFIDRQAGSREPEAAQSLAGANAVVLREALHELLLTGNIHSDMHPGNVFVDPENHRVTLIDLGMNTQVSPRAIVAIREMVFGLGLGNRGITTKAIADLGWNLSGKDLDLTAGNFTKNARALLSASKRASTPPPHDLGMVILSVSKLEPYLRGVPAKEVMSILGEIIPAEQRRLHAEALAYDKAVAVLGRFVKK